MSDVDGTHAHIFESSQLEDVYTGFSDGWLGSEGRQHLWFLKIEMPPLWFYRFKVSKQILSRVCNHPHAPTWYTNCWWSTAHHRINSYPEVGFHLQISIGTMWKKQRCCCLTQFPALNRFCFQQSATVTSLSKICFAYQQEDQKNPPEQSGQWLEPWGYKYPSSSILMGPTLRCDYIIFRGPCKVQQSLQLQNLTCALARCSTSPLLGVSWDHCWINHFHSHDCLWICFRKGTKRDRRTWF